MRAIGNWLNNEEEREIVKELYNSSEFKSLLAAMKEEKFFDENSFDTSLNLKFDVEYYDTLANVKSILLKFSENVEVNAIFRAEDKQTRLIADGQIIVGDKKVAFNLVNGEVQKSEVLLEDLKKLETLGANDSKDDSELIPISSDYYPGMLKDMKQTQSVPPAWTGCLYGGYIYCGQSCGGKIACDSNSKIGINYLDSVCKSHDCCYHTRGVSYKNCYCDSRLCNQAALSTNTAAKTIVRAVMCSSC
ncbi:hypothetical protein [Ornithinibacillus scapharcae]|uniref:hypothetical protein n=1 Tax=Ornithinibacillus scapharcae TaxID=1147159 RepID=UPI000225BD69|nr:hypothetical protein [Ornithinibacillus scapharcae]